VVRGIDIDTPADVRELGALPIPGTVQVIGLAIQGGRALVVASSGGWQDFFTAQNAGLSGNIVLAIIDVNNPRNPQLLATQALGRASRGVNRPVALGNDLYAFSSLGAAGDTPRIFLVDARDPTNLILGQMDVPSEIMRMRAEGDRVYTASPSGLLIYAVNRAQPAIEAEPTTPRINCKGSRCVLSVTCNLPVGLGIECANRINLIVRGASVRLVEDGSLRARGRIRFASGVSNIPPGQTEVVRLRLTRAGKQIKKTSSRRVIRGVLQIRNSPGTATTPTPVRIRLR
jgi:hypothetical protein